MERTTETDIAAVVDWERERTMHADGYAAGRLNPTAFVT